MCAVRIFFADIPTDLSLKQHEEGLRSKDAQANSAAYIVAGAQIGL